MNMNEYEEYLKDKEMHLDQHKDKDKENEGTIIDAYVVASQLVDLNAEEDERKSQLQRHRDAFEAQHLHAASKNEKLQEQLMDSLGNDIESMSQSNKMRLLEISAKISTDKMLIQKSIHPNMKGSTGGPAVQVNLNGDPNNQKQMVDIQGQGVKIPAGIGDFFESFTLVKDGIENIVVEEGKSKSNPSNKPDKKEEKY